MTPPTPQLGLMRNEIWITFMLLVRPYDIENDRPCFFRLYWHLLRYLNLKHNGMLLGIAILSQYNTQFGRRQDTNTDPETASQIGSLPACCLNSFAASVTSAGYQVLPCLTTASPAQPVRTKYAFQPLSRSLQAPSRHFHRSLDVYRRRMYCTQRGIISHAHLRIYP